MQTIPSKADFFGSRGKRRVIDDKRRDIPVEQWTDDRDPDTPGSYWTVPSGLTEAEEAALYLSAIQEAA